MKKSSLTAILLFTSVGISHALTCNITLNPGDNIQTAVDANGAGTTFCLTPGTYRMTSGITAKANDIFDGSQREAILNGSKVMSSWTAGPGYWYATGQTQHNTEDSGNEACRAYTSTCEATYTGCQYADAVMVDGQPLWRVMCLAAIGPGKFFFDYTKQIIYIGDNPTGHVVEAAVATRAFEGGGSAVTVQNLVVKNFANATQHGAIEGRSDWFILNNEVAYNHGGGLNIGAVTSGNYCHHNGQYGVMGGGTGQLVENNEIAFNNTAGVDAGWAAGGSKFWESTNLTVRGNYVHDNMGNGLWDDTDNTGILYENNHTKNNWGNGIFHEIGENAIIRNNLSEGDGKNPSYAGTSMWSGAGIYVNTSENTEIYNNTVINSLNGIGGCATNRGQSLLYPFTYSLNTIYVHDNYIVQQTGSAAGFVTNLGNNSAFTSNNNRFVHNQYCVAGSVFWDWMSTTPTKAQWQGYGEDTTGVWACQATLPPSITSASQAVATVGTPFSYQIIASNVPTAYAATGLPPGLSLNTTSGLISGTPTTAGTFAIVLKASNAIGSGTLTLTLTIAPPAPVITSPTMATGTVGSAFSYTIQATNTPTSYSATGLPTGLALNTTSGLISGTPTVAGTSTVSLQATNAAGTGGATLTLTIQPSVTPLRPSKPILILKPTMPVNAVITAGYDGTDPVIEFRWIISQLNRSGASSSPGSVSLPLPSVAFTSPAPAAQLGLFNLAPGYYQLSVTAVDAQGFISPAAVATTQLLPLIAPPVRVYPNPWRKDHTPNALITFDQLETDSQIYIYTVSGHLVKTLPPSSSSSTWDLTNDSGEKIGAGLYIYRIKSASGQNTKGKLAVIK